MVRPLAEQKHPGIHANVFTGKAALTFSFPSGRCALKGVIHRKNIFLRPLKLNYTWADGFYIFRLSCEKEIVGDFFGFLCISFIQHCFICRPSDSTVSEDAGIEPMTVATSALAVRHSSHSATSHPQATSDIVLKAVSEFLFWLSFAVIGQFSPMYMS